MHKSLRKKTANGRASNMHKKNTASKKAVAKRAKVRKANPRKHPEQNVSFKMPYDRADALINRLVKAKRIRDKLEQLASRHGD